MIPIQAELQDDINPEDKVWVEVLVNDDARLVDIKPSLQKQFKTRRVLRIRTVDVLETKLPLIVDTTPFSRLWGL